jgi:hypothetical protein
MGFNTAFRAHAAGPGAYQTVKQSYATAVIMTAEPVVFSAKDNAYLDSLRSMEFANDKLLALGLFLSTAHWPQIVHDGLWALRRQAETILSVLDEQSSTKPKIRVGQAGPRSDLSPLSAGSPTKNILCTASEPAQVLHLYLEVAVILQKKTSFCYIFLLIWVGRFCPG